jgi:hypothetical protein
MEGTFEVAEMGRRSHMLALNAVSRQVAASQGWTTINMEHMFFSEREYLRNLHHPAEKISLAALKIVLNIASACVAPRVAAFNVSSQASASAQDQGISYETMRGDTDSNIRLGCSFACLKSVLLVA